MRKTGVQIFLLCFLFILFFAEVFVMPTCSLGNAEPSSESWWATPAVMVYLAWGSSLLTLIGLIASCVAAVRAKNSEEAAKEAKQQTLKLSSAFTGLASTWKLGNAIKEIDRIKEVNCSEGKHGVHYLYGNLCDNIIECKSRCRQYLTTEDGTTIQEIIVFLRSLESIFSPHSEIVPEINIRDINEKLTNYKDAINEMTQTIGNSIMEKNNER